MNSVHLCCCESEKDSPTLTSCTQSQDYSKVDSTFKTSSRHKIIHLLYLLQVPEPLHCVLEQYDIHASSPARQFGTLLMSRSFMYIIREQVGFATPESRDKLERSEASD